MDTESLDACRELRGSTDDAVSVAIAFAHSRKHSCSGYSLHLTIDNFDGPTIQGKVHACGSGWVAVDCPEIGLLFVNTGRVLHAQIVWD